MKNVIESWDEVKSIFMDPIFLLTDYDGTLTPIVGRPEAAQLSSVMRNKISELVPLCPVSIISGRSLSDLRDRVGVRGIYYSGNHGFEIEGPDVSFIKEEAERASRALEMFCKEFKKNVQVDDVVVENKVYTASVHYRLVDSEGISKVRETFEDTIEAYLEEADLEVNEGKKIFEIKPSVEWDKGKAVSFLLKNLDYEEETLPIYMGDDVTDEDVFRVLDRGVGVFVGKDERDTLADYKLDNIDEVGCFLDKLMEILG